MSKLQTEISGKILVVDDDEQSRAAMTALIKGAGHGAVTSSTVHGARAGLSAEKPDHVVMTTGNLSRVFINLISNAFDALNGSGNLYIGTRRAGRRCRHGGGFRTRRPAEEHPVHF